MMAPNKSTFDKNESLNDINERLFNRNERFYFKITLKSQIMNLRKRKQPIWFLGKKIITFRVFHPIYRPVAISN